MNNSNQLQLLQVRRIEHCPIPVGDGRTVSARLWLPDTLEKVPAILEYIPYRKRDFYRVWDETKYTYFAQRGYAGVRIDLAGSGDSEGILSDEYARQEQDDAVDAIAWLSQQPWCNGAVGMNGISWGGFNCLQVAARRPPALRAIVSACSTDDRYTDDVHYMGGCLLMDGIDWGAVFQTHLTRPPDPAVSGERWRAMWNQRLDNMVCPLEVWLQHPHRDDYWKHGSICENYEQVKTPALLVGGWLDGYKTALMRMAARLPGPTKCIMGPWPHAWPHIAVPGPAIGILHEMVRWFDLWLKGIENGVMAEPKLRAWIQDSEPPRTHYAVRKGRWIGETTWPSPSIKEHVWHLTDRGLREEAALLSETALPYNLSVGQFGGDWEGLAMPFQLPPDQTYDDALSLCFDSEPLEAPLEILGGSTLKIQIRSDKPVAMIAARLCDVRPDGSTAKVTMGLLNLTHRSGSEHPQPLMVDRWYNVEIWLKDVGYRFPKGHRLRVALSPSYWPIAWPSPEATSLSIRGACQIALPERRPTRESEVGFSPAEAETPPEITNLRPAQEFTRETAFDLARNTVTRRIFGGTGGSSGLRRFDEIGVAIDYRVEREQSIKLDDPNSAVAEFRQVVEFHRDSQEITIKARTRLSSTEQAFILNSDIDVMENGERVFSRSWNPRIPRREV